MTWSILARDPETGELGAAVATRFFAVGALCLRVEGGLGVAATQALVNPLLAPAALRRLRDGLDPAAALAGALDADPGAGVRQLHLLAADGRSARHTGEGCVDWAGHDADADASVAGNMLAGAAVIAATLRGFRAAAGRPLAERLIAALEAGEAAGGDKRGRQSAALLLAGPEDAYPALDLRVDDHADPLRELRRLLVVSGEHFRHYRRFMAGRDHPGVFDRAVLNALIERSRAESAEPPGESDSGSAS